MHYTFHKFLKLVLFYIILSAHAILPAQSPCDTNVSMATARNINVSDKVENCVSGCTGNMPHDSTFKDSYCQFQGAASWFKFRSYNLNSVHISLKSQTLKNLKYIILDENGILVACNVISFSPRNDKQYYIVVFEPEHKTGEFELCIVGYQNGSPNVQYLQVVSTSLGSPLKGPYKPGETLQITYQNLYKAPFDQDLHYFMPIYGQALSEFNDDNFNLISYSFEDESAEFRQVYSDELSWKPQDELLLPIRGVIESTNVPCILGTSGCIPMTPGYGKCSGYGPTMLKSGWAFLNKGCSSGPNDPQFDTKEAYYEHLKNDPQKISISGRPYLDPNYSWGLKYIYGKMRSLTYQVTLPIDIKEKINKYDRDEFYLGFTTFTDGQTGGYSYDRSYPDEDIVYLNLDILDCTNNNKLIVNDTTVCSREKFQLNYSNGNSANTFVWSVIDWKNVDIHQPYLQFGKGIFNWSFTNYTKETGYVKMVGYQIDPEYCTSIPDTFTVWVNPTSIYSGSDQNVGRCSPIKLNAVAIGPAEWTTSGDGYFVDKFDPKTTYIKGVNDSISGEVTLNLRLLDTTGIISCNGSNDDLKVKFITSKLNQIIQDFKICNKDTVITLSANPSNGKWEGMGVYGNYLYPKLMPIGIHKILYRWKDIYGCNYVDTLNIEITNCLCVLDAELISTPAICSKANGSLEVKKLNTVQGPFSYYWNTGSTDSTLTNVPPGIYSVVVYYAGQCQLVLTDTVKDNGNDFAYLEAVIEDCQYIICAGSTISDDFSVQWNNGANTQCINVPLNSDSEYVAELTAYDDCRDTAKFIPDKNIIPIELQLLNYSFIVYNNEGFINITNNGTGELLFVDWYKNNVKFSTDQNLSGLSAGTYVCIAEDIYGCKDTLEVIIDKFVTNQTLNLNIEKINIYPNPTQSSIFILFEKPHSNISTIDIWDSSGKKIKKELLKISDKKYSMGCSDLISGFYKIQLAVDGHLLQSNFSVIK